MNSLLIIILYLELENGSMETQFLILTGSDLMNTLKEIMNSIKEVSCLEILNKEN